MKSYEFTRFYNPKMGKFVYKHKGTGVIVDNIFKPMRAVAKAVFNKLAKPIAKKALEAGISHTGEKLGKKISEKSGDLIMKKLAKMRISSPKQPTTATHQRRPPSKHIEDTEDTDTILNRLISGNGLKKKKR